MDDKDKKNVATGDKAKDACCSTDTQKESKPAENGKKHCCCCGK